METADHRKENAATENKMTNRKIITAPADQTNGIRRHYRRQHRKISTARSPQTGNSGRSPQATEASHRKPPQDGATGNSTTFYRQKLKATRRSLLQ